MGLFPFYSSCLPNIYLSLYRRCHCQMEGGCAQVKMLSLEQRCEEEGSALIEPRCKGRWESDCLCSKQSASDWLKIWSSNWKVIKMRTGFVNKVPLSYQEQCVVALKSWVLIKFCICGFIYSFMSNCNLTALLLEALAGDQKDLIKDCWAVFFPHFATSLLILLLLFPMVLDNAYALCSALLSIIAKHVGNKKEVFLEASITSANSCMKSASNIKNWSSCVFSKMLLRFGSAVLESYPYLVAWQGQKQLQCDSEDAHAVVGYATQL